jgi:hypothetical protein
MSAAMIRKASIFRPGRHQRINFEHKVYEIRYRWWIPHPSRHHEEVQPLKYRLLVPFVVALVVSIVVDRAIQEQPAPSPSYTPLPPGKLALSFPAATRAAPELTVLRRLSLALHGTVPSLAQIREFEAHSAPDRLERWTVRLLADPRYSNYMAERWARAFVGTDQGTPFLFRRDRLVAWLADALMAGVPMDRIVRDLIGSQGLWTDRPATNFVTAATVEGKIDPFKLAGRSVRAFLGQRMDCAQCHDHPFASWKQHQFEAVAAFFGSTRIGLLGLRDDGGTLEVTDQKSRRRIQPAYPFLPELGPRTGTARQRFAVWVTARENRRFARAVANRLWGLLFGRALVEPVDDIPDPPAVPDPLDLLANELVAHHYDLGHLIRVITALAPFRAESLPPGGKTVSEWSSFPVVRLRPEQLIGALIQTSNLGTVDQTAAFLKRVVRFLRQEDFVRQFGDPGEAELSTRPGTIPQRFMLLNSKVVRELSAANVLNAAGRISSMAVSPEELVELCYLVCLTRRPVPQELAVILPQLRGIKKRERNERTEDIFWALINTTEFSWGH